MCRYANNPLRGRVVQVQGVEASDEGAYFKLCDRGTNAESNAADVPLCPLRHGVVPAPTPRMTPDNPFESQPTTFDRSIFAQCLKGILGAGGGESAGGRGERGNAELIKSDQKDEWKNRSLFQSGLKFFPMLP